MIMALFTNLVAKALLVVDAMQEGAALHREMRRTHPGAFGNE